uniref:Uncharacterized protein n=1 Tax=Arundo donax TaxID=35708 RepID=A0A0A9DL44_ARUDO
MYSHWNFISPTVAQLAPPVEALRFQIRLDAFFHQWLVASQGNHQQKKSIQFWMGLLSTPIWVEHLGSRWRHFSCRMVLVACCS